MDNDVNRFSHNIRKGQWCPVGIDGTTGRAFSPATTKPHPAVVPRVWKRALVTVTNFNIPRSVLLGALCWRANVLIMLGAAQQRGEKDE
jgi:hypothetical protein